MARDFAINGETMVWLRFGAHIVSGSITGATPTTSNSGGTSSGVFFQLGLTTDQIHVGFQLNHEEVRTNDFAEIPTDVLWQLGACTISMTLIHYDNNVLNAALLDSMGGGKVGAIPGASLMGAGQALGPNATFGAARIGSSGYRYVGLYLDSPVFASPYFFPAAYLTGQPVDQPLGTQRTLTTCNWRAIPFKLPGPLTTNLSGTTGGNTLDIVTPNEARSSGSQLLQRIKYL